MKDKLFDKLSINYKLNAKLFDYAPKLIKYKDGRINTIGEEKKSKFSHVRRYKKKVRQSFVWIREADYYILAITV